MELSELLNLVVAIAGLLVAVITFIIALKFVLKADDYDKKFRELEEKVAESKDEYVAMRVILATIFDDLRDNITIDKLQTTVIDEAMSQIESISTDSETKQNLRRRREIFNDKIDEPLQKQEVKNLFAQLFTTHEARDFDKAVKNLAEKLNDQQLTPFQKDVFLFLCACYFFFDGDKKTSILDALAEIGPNVYRRKFYWKTTGKRLDDEEIQKFLKGERSLG